MQNASDNVVKVQTALDALTAELTKSSERMISVAFHAQQGPEDAQQNYDSAQKDYQAAQKDSQ